MPKRKKGRTFYCDVCESDYVCNSKDTKEPQAFRAHKANCKLHKELEEKKVLENSEKMSNLEENEAGMASVARSRSVASEVHVSTVVSSVKSYGIHYWSSSSSSCGSITSNKSVIEKTKVDDRYSEMEKQEVVEEHGFVDEYYNMDDEELGGVILNEDGSTIRDEIDIADALTVASNDSYVEAEEEDLWMKTSTRLLQSECKRNSILDVQLFILRNFFWRTPGNFNRVSCEEVNAEVAIKLLERIEQSNMSQEEADEFLRFEQDIMHLLAGKKYPMPATVKTLRRGFFKRIDEVVPVHTFYIPVLDDFFEHFKGANAKSVPPVRCSSLKVENVLADILLRMNPRNISHTMAPEYNPVTEETDESQRIYRGWETSNYAIDIQREVYKKFSDADQSKPLIIYLTCFIDGLVLNSTNSRSAVPVLLSVTNDKERTRGVIGNIPQNFSLSVEELDALMHEEGLKSSHRKFILKNGKQQLLQRYCKEVLGSFLERQEMSKGFDVQIGNGDNAECHRIYVVLANFLGDHPQIHDLCGVMRSACHCCYNKVPSNFLIIPAEKKESELRLGVYMSRDVKKQYLISKSCYLNKRDYILQLNDSRRRDRTTKRREAEKELKTVNGYMSDIKTYELFEFFYRQGY